MRGGIKDMITIDKHRCLYRGLIPITIAYLNLSIMIDRIHIFKRPDNKWTNCLWPFVFLFGTLMAHPYMVIGMNVMYGPLNKTPVLREAHRDMFLSGRYIYRTKGIKGFYPGFAPSLLIYMVIYYDEIKNAIIDTHKSFFGHKYINDEVNH